MCFMLKFDVIVLPKFNMFLLLEFNTQSGHKEFIFANLNSTYFYHCSLYLYNVFIFSCYCYTAFLYLLCGISFELVMFHRTCINIFLPYDMSWFGTTWARTQHELVEFVSSHHLQWFVAVNFKFEQRLNCAAWGNEVHTSAQKSEMMMVI